MWIKFFVIIVVIAVVPSYAQTLSGTDADLQALYKDLIDRQARVKTALQVIDTKIKAAVTDLSPNAALADLVTSLKTENTNVLNFLNINDWPALSTALTCVNVPMVEAGVQFSIKTCYSVLSKISTNSSQLIIQYNWINYYYILKKDMLSTARQQAIEAILNSIYLCYNEYYSYAIGVIAASVKYTRIDYNLLYAKMYLCTCPNSLSSTATTTYAVVDNTINLVQDTVINWESEIRNASAATAILISTFSSSIKTISDFSNLYTALENLKNYVLVLMTLNTAEVVTATNNCSDAALTGSFLQHKMDQYVLVYSEAARNMTLALQFYGLVYAHYSGKYYSLSDSQRKSCQAIIASTNNLIEDYRQYLLSLSIGYAKLLIQQILSNTALKGCACSSGSTATTPTTTTTKGV